MTKLLLLLWLSGAAMAHSPQHAQKFVEAWPKKEVVFPFTHSERKRWHYVPMNRTGVSYKNMTPAQRKAADAFLGSWLSATGSSKLKEIVALESVLGGGLFSSYDPNRYFFALFGNPDQSPWAFRFEGHHLSLNFTHAQNATSLAPFFWGANPAKHVKDGKTIEPLHAEQHLALALVNSFSDEQKKTAIISADPFSEIILTPNEKVRSLSPKGIGFTSLTANQQKMLVELIQVYLTNFAEPTSKAYAERVLKQTQSLHFAWAGATQSGQGHYYRIQNEEFIVEYDNTQDDANHIHTVWHDLKDNFGEDLLRTHYQKKH